MTRTREELSKLTVADLKAALKALGKPVLGKKDELVERLLAAEAGADAPAAGEAPAATADDAAAAPAADAGEEAAAADAAAAAAAAAAPEAPAAVAAADAAAGAKDTPEPPSEDGGSKGGTGTRAKIEFNEQTMKQMPAKVTVIKPVTSEPLKTTKSYQEKLKERAGRFKDPEVEKVKQRAERFGLFNEDVEREKAKKRAERFGTYNADLDEERKRQRAERFGIEDPEAKLAARAERFKGTAAPAAAAGGVAGGGATGSADFEALKKARAARFGVAT